MLKKNGGITLIALVITIIVLLILAGVSLAMLTGDDGVLNKASNAKIANDLGAAKDVVGTSAAAGIANYYENAYGSNPDTTKDVEDFIVEELTKKATAEATEAKIEASLPTTVTLTQAATGANGLELEYTNGNKTASVTGTITASGSITWGDIAY